MAKMNNGLVFWITGLSGSGKTTVANGLSLTLREHGMPIVLLDGDQLREIFDNTLYSREARLTLSQRYATLCAMISEQGIHVIIATISMFHQTQAWNRAHINNYIEVYLKVPLDILKQRDTKAIYSAAKKEKLTNIVGLDLDVEEPIAPDILIENYGDVTPESAVKKIVACVSQRVGSLIHE